ncbi:hypothetical protein SARC_08510 [Sphaeroforma arctica JP610]|uniref:Uncharacterized protein n=1 Tax=Sphaeroforma arctica JP610 TaxID=667725 RepID=A0A0L0FQM6_9EUKA|nr:hypothetical protein SARC_08510 [Sphaeroforma arctica JP610]KNC79077.1 hypothetical protein SARC_08510 [Sphaeroforma arctica JP610]|eukprot:XP_014152979.1 hypothetical protein SARC_08510 [Sphaeroforma arctica JP610]
MLKERDMNHNTNTQRTANSDGAPVKMGRVVNFIDVDDLDSDETGNYGPMPPAVGMSKSKVSRVNAPRAQSHASAANSARTIKQDSKQNSLSKTMNAKPCASAASLNANSSVSNKKSSSPGPVVPAIGSTTMQKRVISNIEGIPKKALAGPNAQLDSPPPATIPLTETQFDPKSSDKAINYLKRPRRKSSGAGNTVVSTEEQLGGNSTSEDRKTVLHAVESGTQSQVQKRSQISPSNYAPSQAQISSLVGTAKGSLNIRVGPDGVVNMSTDDEDNSPPPKAVKLSPPPAREKPQSQHSIQRPNRNRVKRKIENVAHTETVPRKSTHVNSDDRPMAMNTNTNTNTNTNATTYTNATKLDTSTGTIKTANTKPSTTSRKTTDGKSATTRRRVVPYLLESGSDTLSKRYGNAWQGLLGQILL